jgi:hypothetical protein
MAGTPPTPRGLRLPWAVLLSVALVAWAERSVRRHRLDHASEWSADRGWASRAATRDAAGCRVLCFGDSQVKFAVVPSLLAARLGATAMSLAVHGGQPQEAYFLLRRVLASGGRPAAVVVDFKPFLLTHPVQARLGPYAELLGPAESAELAWAAGDASVFTGVAARRLLPSLADRDGLRDHVRATLAGEDRPGPGLVMTRLRNWNRNRGAQVMPEGEFSAVPLDVYGHFFRRWSCDPVSEEFLQRFLDLAAAQGARVVYLLPPILPALQSLCERTGFDADYVRFVRALQLSNPGLTVLDGRHSGYDAAALCDPLHLNRLGATVLSRDLAEILARPRRSRWLELPTFDRSKADTTPEDMNASAVALRRGGPGTRRR